LENCHKERSYFVCSFFVDLSDYNNKTITHHFEVEDLAGNKDTSSNIKARVDCKPTFKELTAYIMNSELRGGQDE